MRREVPRGMVRYGCILLFIRLFVSEFAFYYLIRLFVSMFTFENKQVALT